MIPILFFRKLNRIVMPTQALNGYAPSTDTWCELAFTIPCMRSRHVRLGALAIKALLMLY